MKTILEFGCAYKSAYYGRQQVTMIAPFRVVHANQNKQIALAIKHDGRTQCSIVALDMKDAGVSYTRRNIILEALHRLGVQ